MHSAHLCPVCNGSGAYLAPMASTCNVLPTRATHPCHGCESLGWVAVFEAEPAEVPGFTFDPPVAMWDQTTWDSTTFDSTNRN
jgi:hypothetical protein